MKLSVIIPFYNEQQNVPLVLEEFKKFSGQYDFELICVNDGSKDNTEAVFKNLMANGQYPFVNFVFYSPNGGYGHALMTGVRKAQGVIIAWTHADLQTPVADVFKAYEAYQRYVTASLSPSDGESAAASAGERLQKNVQTPKILIKGWRINRTLQQIILSFGMAVIASVILRRKLTEINAQPKLFPKELIPLLANAPKDFSLDLYLLCIAKNNGYEIKTIDVRFPNRLHGESSWAFSWRNKLKTIWRSVKYIWRLRKEV